MLAYDIEGEGRPVVFLHGLTFDRRSWRPIIERLDGRVTSIAVDLPGHGESDGPADGDPVLLTDVVEQVHEVVARLGVPAPIVVGHSMSAAIAFLYAANHPTVGVTVVDQGTDIRPFAELVQRIAPVLRGPGFDQAWQTFEDSIGMARVPEPARSAVAAGRRVRQDLVLGYWHQVLTTEPAELQAWIDTQVARVQVPCLAVFGREATPGERERFAMLPDVEIEEWAGEGHCVHLVDPERFAKRLLSFVDHCEAGRG